MEYRILYDVCIGCGWCRVKGQISSVLLSFNDNEENELGKRAIIQKNYDFEKFADYCPVGAIVPVEINESGIGNNIFRNYLPPDPHTIGITSWGNGNKTLQLYNDYDYFLGSEILETFRIKSEKDSAETENTIFHFAEINSNPLPALKKAEGLLIVDFNMYDTAYANNLGKIFTVNKVLINSICYRKVFSGKQNKEEKPEHIYVPGKLNQVPDEKDLAIITFSW
jgi:hypothetical protein